MSETKQEILRTIDNLPDEILGDLLNFLKKMEQSWQETQRMSQNLNTILTEDKEVLEKLAK